MSKTKLPDRWLKYTAMGSVIPGTQFLACKVPLQEAFLRKLPENERFGPLDLVKAFPKIRLLVDLTNTDRYYFNKEFTEKGIKYEKIFCPGHAVPPKSVVQRFFSVVNSFLRTSTSNSNTVIAVHCTHGVNRTGYLICRYMIEHLNVPPEEAMEHFHLARGHKIERQNYIDDLKNSCKRGSGEELKLVNSRSTLKRKRHYKDSQNYCDESKVYGANKNGPIRFEYNNSGPDNLMTFNSRTRDQFMNNYATDQGRMQDEIRNVPNGYLSWRIKHEPSYLTSTTNDTRQQNLQPSNPKFHHSMLPGMTNAHVNSPPHIEESGERYFPPSKFIQRPGNYQFSRQQFETFRGSHQFRKYNEWKRMNSGFQTSWRNNYGKQCFNKTTLMNTDIAAYNHPSNQVQELRGWCNAGPAGSATEDFGRNTQGPHNIAGHVTSGHYLISAERSQHPVSHCPPKPFPNQHLAMSPSNFHSRN